MKLTYLILLLIIYGCGEPYPKEKLNIDMLIFGTDTIVVIGAKGIDYSKGNFELYGHGDKEVWYHNIKFNYPKDSFLLKFDSLWVLQYKGEDSFDINIESHNGDVLTGKAVKNVYNNK